MHTNAELFSLALNQSKGDFGRNSDLNAEKERLYRIWDVAHMSMSEVVKATGLTQAAFAKGVGIPHRTVQNWCIGSRKCPEYVRLLLSEHYGLI